MGKFLNILSIAFSVILLTFLAIDKKNKNATKPSDKTLIVESSSVVELFGPIEMSEIKGVINALELIRKSGATKAVLKISSPGGSVLAGNELLNYMRHSGLTIDTYCIIMCASMAAIIFEEGNTRIMSPQAMLMFHPARIYLEGYIHDTQKLLGMFKKMLDGLVERIAKKVPEDKREEFLRANREEIWLSFEQAKELNLVDKELYLLEE